MLAKKVEYSTQRSTSYHFIGARKASTSEVVAQLIKSGTDSISSSRWNGIYLLITILGEKTIEQREKETKFLCLDSLGGK